MRFGSAKTENSVSLFCRCAHLPLSLFYFVFDKNVLSILNITNRNYAYRSFLFGKCRHRSRFFELTRQFGEWMGRNGHMLVFGGCNLGLMECVAHAVHEAGGLCIGAVPTIVEKGGRTSDYVDVKIMCDNLSDRKDIMLAKSDVLVALPGGVGTLDEIFTVVASASIGYHHKRVILYNMKGFWNPLLTMLDSMKKAGVIRRGFDDQLLVASTQDELVEMLSREG